MAKVQLITAQAVVTVLVKTAAMVMSQEKVIQIQKKKKTNRLKNRLKSLLQMRAAALERKRKNNLRMHLIRFLVSILTLRLDRM